MNFSTIQIHNHGYIYTYPDVYTAIEKIAAAQQGK